MTKLLSAVKMLLTLKCEQSTRIVSASLDRDLSAVERWAIRLHCISCWSCRRFGKQIRQLKEALGSHPQKTGNDQRLSSDAIHRIEEAIRNEPS